MKVEEVMTELVHTVRAETPLKDVAALLVERGISGVPVLDADGTPIGVVSETDILHKEADPAHDSGGLLAHLFHRGGPAVKEKLEARTAGEAMTSPPALVRPRTPVDTAAAMMLERGTDRLLVVDDARFGGDFDAGGKLVGIVTRGDFVRAFARSDADLEREIHELIESHFMLSPGEVSVAVERGDVRLAGDVDLKNTAESLAAAVRRVPGVVSLESDLTWRMDEVRLSSTRDGIYAGTGAGARWPN